MIILFLTITENLNLHEEVRGDVIRFSEEAFPRYNNKSWDETVNTKFLILQIYYHLNWQNHIDQLVTKLSGACYAVKSVSHISNSL
jgi:hypothetical protein